MFERMGRSHGSSSACVSPRRGRPQRSPAGAGIPGVLPGVLVGALLEHYGSPGRLSEYRRQFERASRSPVDDPSVFAIELETLARRAFADVNASVSLQLVRDRFINGQAECSLRRHLDSVGPDTSIRDIVVSCCVWESHADNTDSWESCHEPERPRVVYHVVDDSKPKVASQDSDVLGRIMRHFLPTPAVSPPKAILILSDRELLIQRLLGTVHPVQPVVQGHSSLTDIEILLQSMLPVGLMAEENVQPPAVRQEPTAGCFRVVSWAMRLRGALCWMSHFLYCGSDGR